MKKYYIKPIIILSAMVVMVLGLNYISKDKVDIKIIQGDIKNIGGISLVYTPAVKDFKREEIVISKDGIKSNIKSDYVIGRDFIDIDKEHSSFLKWKYECDAYENDEYIGLSYIEREYIGEGKQKNYISIRQKNKKTKQVEDIKVPITKSDNRQSLQSLFNTTYKNDLYIVLLGTAYNIKGEIQTQKLYIVKVDIENKKLKIMKEIDIQENVRVNNLMFKNEDKMYIEIYNYTEKESYTDFIIYDMNKDALSNSNKIMDNNHNGDFSVQDILDYSIEDNKISILIKDKNLYAHNDGNISKYVYSIDEEIIKLEDVIDYDLNINYDYYYKNTYGGLGIRKIKLIDDKIYSLYQNVTTLNKETKNGKQVRIQGNEPVEFLVFDTKQNKTVYEAQIITGDKNIGNNLYLVKDY